MAVSDSKKVATYINRLGEEAQIIRDAIARIEIIQAKFDTANPSLTDTGLTAGNITTIKNATAAMKTEANRAVWTALINARVDSHQGKVLD